jgi:hypothetical protein
MKKLLSAVLTSTLVFSVAGVSTAIENAKITDDQMKEINDSCTSSSKGALYPQEFFEECVDEKKQALIEQQTGVSAKDEG